MSFITRTGNGNEFPQHPKGAFIFTIADIQPDVSNGMFPGKPQIRWMCDSTEARPDNNELFREPVWTGVTINDKSNLKRMIEAVGLDPEDPFWDQVNGIEDLHCMLGMKFLGNVVHKTKTDGKPQARIDTVMPVPQAGAPVAPTPAPSAQRTSGPRPSPRPAMAGAATASDPSKWGPDE